MNIQNKSKTTKKKIERKNIENEYEESGSKVFGAISKCFSIRQNT